MTPTRIRTSISTKKPTRVATPVSSGPRRSGIERTSLAIPASSTGLSFGVVHAAARLLPQVTPDLRDVATEGLAAHHLRAARPRQVDGDDPLHAPGPVGHHDHPVGELDRLGDAVRDQDGSLFQLLLDLQHLVAEQ